MLSHAHPALRCSRQPCSGVRQVTPRLAKRPRPHWRAHTIAQGKKDPAMNARACTADWPRLAQVVCIPSINPTLSSMQPAYVIGREKFWPSPPSCCVITVSLFGLPHCTVCMICKLCGAGEVYTSGPQKRACFLSRKP